MPEELLPNLDKAKEIIFSLDFDVFKSQVVSYLEPEDQSQFGSPQAWDNIRLQVIEALSGNRS